MGIIEEIKHDEEFASRPYFWSGLQMVGYGFDLDHGITEDEAEALLIARVSNLRKNLADQLPWLGKAHSEVQLVLLNIAYQIGLAEFMKMKESLALIEDRSYISAAEDLMHTKWAKSKPLRARKLTARIAKLGLP